MELRELCEELFEFYLGNGFGDGIGRTIAKSATGIEVGRIGDESRVSGLKGQERIQVSARLPDPVS